MQTLWSILIRIHWIIFKQLSATHATSILGGLSKLSCAILPISHLLCEKAWTLMKNWGLLFSESSRKFLYITLKKLSIKTILDMELDMKTRHLKSVADYGAGWMFITMVVIKIKILNEGYIATTLCVQLNAYHLLVKEWNEYCIDNHGIFIFWVDVLTN